MDSTEIAGWVGAGAGLLGALVGGAASLWGTKMSQDNAAVQAQIGREHEIAAAKEQRMFELARGAMDAALIELHALQRLIDQTRHQAMDEDQQESWEAPVEEHLDRIGTLLYRVPDDQVRERLQRVIYVADRHHLAGPSYRDAFRWLSVSTREAILCTSAHLREQELPPPLPTFVTHNELVMGDDESWEEAQAAWAAERRRRGGSA